MQLGQFFASLGAVVLYGLSALGWGAIMARLSYGSQRHGWAFTAALGLGAWICVGGVLNVLRLAGPATLDVLSAIGAVASLVYLQTAFRDLPDGIRSLHGAAGSVTSRCTAWLPYAIIVAALVFLVATVMPTLVFNWDDDLRTYLVRPIRMLQTGTVGGDPFDTLGIDSLGAQSFLHAPFVVHLGPAFTNGADAILCFALSGCLLIELARRVEAGWLITSLAVCAFVAIHPQIVNISAVYSGSLMTLVVVSASLGLLESAHSTFRSMVPPALATASLMALKGTFAVFVLTYWALFFATLLLTERRRQRTLLTAGVLMLFGAVFLTPWVAIYLPRYLSALKQSLAAANQAGVFVDADGIGALFSQRELFWGGNLLAYETVALLMAFVFALALWKTGRKPESGQVFSLL